MTEIRVWGQYKLGQLSKYFGDKISSQQISSGTYYTENAQARVFVVDLSSNSIFKNDLFAGSGIAIRILLLRIADY